MGRYQWQLFFVIGFGWAQDNLWPIVTSLILSPIASEFRPSRPPLLTLAQNIGLLAGAIFWGFGCDVFGRKWGFVGVHIVVLRSTNDVDGLRAESHPRNHCCLWHDLGIFAQLCSYRSIRSSLEVSHSFSMTLTPTLVLRSSSFGVGGNLPVDSAIFLEFLPQSHQYLLTVLSIFWAFAQLLATLIAWPLLGYRTCQVTDTDCTRSENMGWRYFVITMGGVALIMFAIRFIAFHIYESPKYYMGKGRDEDAVRIVHEVARRNGKISNLTIDDLRACESMGGMSGQTLDTDARAAIKRKLESLSFNHISALFSTRRLAFSTSMIMLVWAFIGLAFPLYVSIGSLCTRSDVQS